MSRSLSIVVGLAAAITIAACSNPSAGTDGHAGGSDGSVTGDGQQTGCGYTESMDADNDNVYGDASGNPEDTGLMFHASAVTICGDINGGHFDSDDTLVDFDAYTFTVTAPGGALVEFTAPGAAALTAVNVQVFDNDSGVLAGEADFTGTHGATSMTLAAGLYGIDMTALNASAVSSSSTYKITIAPDTFATRCPKGTTPTYTEAHDGSGTGNDMVDVSFSPDDSLPVAVLTAATTDAPEATGITVGSGSAYMIAGTSADVPERDEIAYLDEDTYAITTGAGTNQLAIRVDWATAGNNDYDWYLFDVNTATFVSQSYQADATGPEATTIAVKPSTSYWLWTAPNKDSTVPEGYDITVCGESYSGS